MATSHADAEAKANNVLQKLREFDAGRNVDELGKIIMNAAGAAASHRAAHGIDSRLEYATASSNNKYSSEDAEFIGEVYMGVTNNKIRAFKSWVSDIIVNSEDRPFTVRPSPVPDLPISVEDTVLDIFLDEVKARGVPTDIETTLAQLKQVAKGHVEAVTEANAKKLEDLIADQLTEGGWRNVFDEFINDMGTYPTAFLKGPHIAYVKRMRWNGSKAEAYDEPVYKLSRVSPYDMFPSPESTTPQDGRYIIQRARMTPNDLLDSAKLSGFREDAIRAVIAKHRGGWKWRGMTDKENKKADLSVAGTPTDGAESTGGMYDVLVYYGGVTGVALAKLGLEGLDLERVYESEVWVCDGVVLRAILNPHPTGRRPFFASSFDKVPGDIWGRGLPDLIKDIQRVCNATTRAMVKNMAFSSGPIGEADMSRLTSEDDINTVEPYRIYQVDGGGLVPSAQPALRFHNIMSNSRELTEVYERFLKQADDVSGIPAYVLGNPQVAGAGRTLGGLSLLMGNAAKGIKKVISQIDRDIIEPVVGEYAAFNLMFNDNPDIKFDTFVVARGSSGLLQQELSQSRSIELMQLLSQMVNPADPNSIVPVEGLKLIIRDVIRGLGYRADEIVPSSARANELDRFLGAAGGGAMPTTQQGTAPPSLDGRSGAALAAQASGA